MSIQNRFLKEGSHTVKLESKFQTFIGKLICMVKGHKEITFKAKGKSLKYCMCCWKEIEENE